ncbi:MAG: PEP-CTERM sorting domain-containing protein [Opitutaceae bacterium]|jgi:hypothetical protein
MNTSYRSLLVVAALLLTATAHSQVIFSDTFEGSNTSDLNNQFMSDGVTSYSATYNSSVFKARASAETSTTNTNLGLGSTVGQIFLNAGNRSAYIAASSNFDAIESYSFNIGYLLYAGSGQFGINARSTSNSINGGFLMSWSGNTATFSYVDSLGASTTLGSVTATLSNKASSYYLTDVQVTVTGNTQQLSVAGTAIGTAVATQSTFGDSSADKIRVYGLTTASSADIQIDNLTATAIPEPTTASFLLGAGALALVGFRRAKRD